MTEPERNGGWRVEYSPSAKRQKKRLPEKIKPRLASLTWDLERHGPAQPQWMNYSKLTKGKNVPPNAHHCHIKSGHPTYVVCWQVIDKTIKIIEIFYVGTHENTPY